VRSHLQILKQISGVRSTVATAILLKELDVLPFQAQWWLRAIRFRNDLASLPVENAYKTIARDTRQAAVTRNVKNWAWSIFRGVRDFGYELVVSVTDMTHIGVPRFTQLLDAYARAASVWANLDFYPRTCLSRKSRLCTYNAWFARPFGCARKCSLSLPLPARSVA
jgi:hypothetical protein